MPGRACLAAFAVALGACSAAPPGPRGLSGRETVAPFLGLPAELREGALEAVSAFPGLRFDWAVRVVHQPRGDRYFVAEREGRLWSFRNRAPAPEKKLVLDLSSRTQGYYDCGLTGLAFHPDYGKAGSPHAAAVFVWYNYTTSPQGSPERRPRYRTPSFNRLSRFELPDVHGLIDPASEVVLIDQHNQTTFHEGGAMFFHPEDGFLWLTVGDDFDHANAQRLDGGLFAGVLRIDVDQDRRRSHPIRRQPRNGVTQHYAVPNDNPFVDRSGSALEEFWALGLRSPHSMSLDRATGRVFVADVGDKAREEVSLLVRGGNYEWPFREGTVGTEPPSAVIGTRVGPLLEYPHADADNCVIGGFVYRGTAHPELVGRYLFGDGGSNRVWALEITPEGRAGVRREIARLPGATGYFGGLSAIVPDAEGEPLLVRVGARMAVQRLVPAAGDRTPAPALLSRTGLFADVGALRPSPGLVRYEVNVPQWADGAVATRWAAVPSGPHLPAEKSRVAFSPEGAWAFPEGTVLVQHLELPTGAREPPARRRVETRLLVRGRGGDFYPLTYVWRDDGSDADLQPAGGAVLELPVVPRDGPAAAQEWTVPSRAQCRQCHQPGAGTVLGLSARQMRREVDYPAARDDQIRAWSHAGLFHAPVSERRLRRIQPLVALDAVAEPLDRRVRSYLDANCSGCHRPQGVRTLFDARAATPLARAGIVDGELLDPMGMAGARVVRAGDPGASILLLRLHATGPMAMPPVGKQRVDAAAVAAVSRWIEDLPRTR